MSQTVTTLDVNTAPDGGHGTDYIRAQSGIMSWLTTVDHKRIGLMYLISTFIAFAMGGVFALILRLELLTPKETIMSANTYNQVFTLHGAMMVFLFIIPSIPGALGNFLLPIMIGAKDVAFPKLNLLSLYLYWIGALFTLSSLIYGRRRHGLDVLRAVLEHGDHDVGPQRHVRRVHPGLLQSILTGLNFIVTVHKLRAPGMGWYQMPLLLWAIYATSIIQVLATPVLGITLLLLIVGARVPHRHLRPGAGRRPGALPALLLVLQPPGRLHHDPAGHGHHQRAHHRPRARAGSSATRPSRSPASPSPWSASSCGATTCSSPGRASWRRSCSRS